MATASFWAQLVRETLRRNRGAEVDFHVERKGDAAEVDLRVVDEKGEFPRGLVPSLEITGPGRAVRTMAMRQTAPGHYHASVPLKISADAPWRFQLSGDGLPEEALAFAGNARAVFYPYPDEYRFYPPDGARLEAIAEETGGVFRPGNGRHLRGAPRIGELSHRALALLGSARFATLFCRHRAQTRSLALAEARSAREHQSLTY